MGENFLKYSELEGSSKYVIIICPFVPYEETSNVILDDSNVVENWIIFLQKIAVDVSICGTINPSWVDRVNCSMVSSHEKFYGLVDKPCQIVPSQFQKWSNYEVDDFIKIENEIDTPEIYFVEKILIKYEIPKPSLTHSLIPGDGKILFFIGASSIHRCYNYDSILRLGESLMNKLQSEIIFIYGPNEYELYSKSYSNNNSKHIYFESGEFDQLIEMIASAKLAFTHETFYYHLLNLYGVPHVLVSGGGHWRRFIYPNSISTVITNRLPCFNCDWRCPYDKSYCISEITEKALLCSLVERYRESNLGFKVYSSDTNIDLYDYTDNYVKESIHSNYITNNNKEIAKILIEKQVTIDNLLLKNNKISSENDRFDDARKSLMHKLSHMQYKLNTIYLENEKNKRSLELMGRVIDHKINHSESNDN